MTTFSSWLLQISVTTQGSERARLSTEDPARVGAVLMDENLRRSNLSSPLLIDPVAYARYAAQHAWRPSCSERRKAKHTDMLMAMPRA